MVTNIRTPRLNPRILHSLQLAALAVRSGDRATLQAAVRQALASVPDFARAVRS